MSSYQTGNLPPSIDPRDLDDNATTFDLLLLSPAASVPDRLGALRKTWSQMERDAQALIAPNVAALAAAVAAANKGIYFSAASPVAISTYDLGAFVRSLGGAADASAFRELVGAAKSGANTDITSITGSAAKLTTARSISVTGDAAWSVNFDGSTAAAAALTLANSGVAAGTYGTVTVDAKGRATGGSVATPVANGGTAATNAAAARTNLGVRNTDTAAVYGFNVSWGASSLSVGPGSAYIPGTGAYAESAAAISVPLSGLTSGTFYHLYLYLNSGTASVELSATAPVSAATGGYAKTGDTSRRYLFSVLANGATSVHRFVHDGPRVEYIVAVANAPFAVLATGTATTSTNVDCSAAVPTTAVSIIAGVINTSTANVRISNPDIGAASVANANHTVLGNGNMQAEIFLNSAYQFNYLYEATPTTSVSVRVNGYRFRR